MKSYKKAFTLLEVLLAVVLFTTGIVALLGALNIGIFSVVDLEETTQALNLAQATMECVINRPFDEICNANCLNVCASFANFPKFSVSVNVTGADPKQIDVRVSWSVKGGSTAVNLTTLKTNE